MNILARIDIRKLLLVPALVLGLGVAAGVVTSPVALAEDTNCSISKGITGGMECTGQGTQTDEDGNVTPAENRDIGSIFKTITDALLFIVGAVAVIMLIFGGFRYVTSGGDAQAVTSAKNTILYAVIGIVVALLAFAVLDFVTDQFVGSD